MHIPLVRVLCQMMFSVHTVLRINAARRVCENRQMAEVERRKSVSYLWSYQQFKGNAKCSTDECVLIFFPSLSISAAIYSRVCFRSEGADRSRRTATFAYVGQARSENGRRCLSLVVTRRS